MDDLDDVATTDEDGHRPERRFGLRVSAYFYAVLAIALVELFLAVLEVSTPWGDMDAHRTGTYLFPLLLLLIGLQLGYFVARGGRRDFLLGLSFGFALLSMAALVYFGVIEDLMRAGYYLCFIALFLGVVASVICLVERSRTLTLRRS